MKEMLIFWACLVTLGMPAMGLAADAVAIAQQLQEQYDRTSSLAADFQQVTRMQMTGRSRQASGTVTFKKPGLMRWDYTAPEPQVLVSDGKIFNMYIEKSKQLIRSSAKEALQSDVTYAFFAGKGNLVRDFEPSLPAGGLDKNQDQHLVKLVPRQAHPQVAILFVWARKSDFLIERLRIEDHFGSVTDISFANIERNKEIPSDLFVFVPPEGTEIIDQ